MHAEDFANSVSPLRAAGRFFWELIKAFLIAMVIIVPIRYFLVQPFFVRGASMEPSFDDGEYLVIDQISYRVRDILRGETVVFRYPLSPDQFFIKRVVGLPGERVQVQNGQVIIFNGVHPQGAVLDESGYLLAGLKTGGRTVDMQLAEDEYFVMGDNRADSSDSRFWGALPRQNIVGRVWVRAFPVNRFAVFAAERVGFLGI